MAEPITTGSTYRHRRAFTKDGQPWNLAAAQITVHFRKPEGTLASFAASVVDAAGGVAEYQNLTTLFDRGGTWTESWQVVDGPTDVKSEPRAFAVVPAP